jgi:hypothetical protein
VIETETSGSEQDWRLRVDLEDASAAPGLVARLRGPDLLKASATAVAQDVVITHDRGLLFAYSASETSLARARSAIEEILGREGVNARSRVSHWDDERDEWRQVDPPPAAQQLRSEEDAERDSSTLETRTLVSSAGRLVRVEFEQTMERWAAELGLDCKIVEHPHLLTTQVAFTVKGPKHKIDEFSKGLIAEGWATVRTETGVMLSPL